MITKTETRKERRKIAIQKRPTFRDVLINKRRYGN